MSAHYLKGKNTTFEHSSQPPTCICLSSNKNTHSSQNKRGTNPTNEEQTQMRGSQNAQTKYKLIVPKTNHEKETNPKYKIYSNIQE